MYSLQKHYTNDQIISSSRVNTRIALFLQGGNTTSHPRITYKTSFDAESLNLGALAKIIIKLLDKKNVFRQFEGCRNNEPNQLAHRFCNEIDPRTRANDCFHVVFPKEDLFLTNELVQRFQNRCEMLICIQVVREY